MTDPLRYIISGGPGSGKTTLINELKQSGYTCSPEVSRRVIMEEVAEASDCLPWKDIVCFSDKVLAGMQDALELSVSSPLTFFDRGIPDIIAYLRIAGLPVHDKFIEAMKKNPYQPRVFILPPWNAIYINDPERWQSFAEATTIYHGIRESYSSFGFELIEVPEGALAGRMAFVLDNCK